MAAKKKEATEAPAKKKPEEKKAAAPSSKLSTFLASKKIDPRRVLIASRKLEALRPEDRALRHARKNKKEGAADAGGGDDKKAPEAPRKPRSGRPVTHRALDAALHGKKISGPAKTRLLRAVNHLLEQKKADKVDLKTLF